MSRTRPAMQEKKKVARDRPYLPPFTPPFPRHSLWVSLFISMVVCFQSLVQLSWTNAASIWLESRLWSLMFVVDRRATARTTTFVEPCSVQTKNENGWGRAQKKQIVLEGRLCWAIAFCRPHFVHRPCSWNSMSFYSSSLRLIGNWLIMKASNTHFVETISGYIHMGVASFCREYLCWIVLVVGSDWKRPHFVEITCSPIL